MFKSLYRFLHPKWQNAFLDYKVDLKPRYSQIAKFHHNPFLIKEFEKNTRRYRDTLQSCLAYKEEILKITSSATDTLLPYWHNHFLPGLDIIVLYTMLRNIKPKIYLEIGSGHSTKVAYKAITEGKLTTEIISIDPYPRTEIDQIADKVIKQPVEAMSFDDDIFTQLKSGDILFIDSSHRILPNSDCAFIYNELIPSLPSGVILHIHDIYVPYDYPQFMCDRLYNENEFLAAYMLSNPEYFDILLPNFYAFKNQGIWNEIAPIFEAKVMENVEKHGGSIWLKKK